MTTNPAKILIDVQKELLNLLYKTEAETESDENLKPFLTQLLFRTNELDFSEQNVNLEPLKLNIINCINILLDLITLKKLI